MSQRTNRHQRRPSQGVFVLPENISASLADDIAPPPAAASAAAAQAPPPPHGKSFGGVHLPPQSPSKPAEETSTSGRSVKG